MRITIVLGAFFPVPPTMGGAVEKAWFSLAKEFAARGHEVTLISRKMPEFPHEETRDGIQYLRVSGFDSPRSLIWLKVLDAIYSFRVLSALPPADIVVTNTFWLPIMLRNPKFGQIYVHVGRYPKGQMRFYNRAARLQAPSKAIADAIQREKPEFAQKISIIPYPAPGTRNLSPPPPIEGREKIILFVGRVHPEKGVHLLVDAFVAGVRTIFAEWKLMIVGPAKTELGGGGEDYLHSLRHSSESAASEIEFTGPIFDRSRLEEVFRAARLFVYPSLAERGESFGLAPLEAMTHGCAVVVSNLDCFRDFVLDEKTGFVFDHRTSKPAEALSQKLANILANPDRLSRVAKEGHSRSSEYSIDRVADRFLSDFTAIHPYAERTNR